jgi:SNF2 family DNA or RNA helicase
MYEFKTEPYAHQKQAWQESWDKEYYALFMEMGTGKSKVAIDTIAALYEAKKIDTALILAPKGVYDNWVQGEIPTHLPDRIKRKVLRWQPNVSKKFLAELKDFALPALRQKGYLHLFVMNVEAFSSGKGAETALDFLKLNPKSIMIVDESTTIKNRQAQRTKNIVKCGRVAKYRRILTGSPITKSPMDLFSQCDFLAEKCLGFNSFYAFQSRYAVVQKRTMGARSFNEVVGYRRLDELTDKLDPISNRVLKQDCLDLPDKVYQVYNVQLTGEQKNVYEMMKKLALAQLDNGELATTQSVLTQIMRLQQITCGHLRTDDGELRELKSNRLDALMEIVEEVQGKAIIWATWSHDLVMIADALRRRFGPEAAATYYGETPQDERQRIVTEFQKPDSTLRFFVGQPKTGGYGITLTEANTMIYYSNSYDLEIRLQSEDRAHRIGQKKPVTYIDMLTPKTIDEKIIKALRNKINLAGAVLGEQARQWLI